MNGMGILIRNIDIEEMFVPCMGSGYVLRI